MFGTCAESYLAAGSVTADRSPAVTGPRVQWWHLWLIHSVVWHISQHAVLLECSHPHCWNYSCFLPRIDRICVQSLLLYFELVDTSRMKFNCIILVSCLMSLELAVTGTAYYLQYLYCWLWYGRPEAEGSCGSLWLAAGCQPDPIVLRQRPRWAAWNRPP